MFLMQAREPHHGKCVGPMGTEDARHLLAFVSDDFWRNINASEVLGSRRQPRQQLVGGLPSTRIVIGIRDTAGAVGPVARIRRRPKEARRGPF